MAIDWDKPLRTKGGWEVTGVHRMPQWAMDGTSTPTAYIVRTNDDVVRWYNENGTSLNNVDDLSLENVPQKHKVYVNVYWKPDGSLSLGGVFMTLELAKARDASPLGWVREIKEFEVDAPK